MAIPLLLLYAFIASYRVALLYHITMLFTGQCKGKGKDNLKVKLSLYSMKAQGQTEV